jgi:hypothetical protein
MLDRYLPVDEKPDDEPVTASMSLLGQTVARLNAVPDGSDGDAHTVAGDSYMFGA